MIIAASLVKNAAQEMIIHQTSCIALVIKQNFVVKDKSGKTIKIVNAIH